MDSNIMSGDCGGPSASQTLASHFVRDKALRDEGFEASQPPQQLTSQQLVNEFLDERFSEGVNPFHMGCLLDQLDTIEGGVVKPQDHTWANEFHRVNGQMHAQQSLLPHQLQHEPMGGMLPWVSEFRMGPNSMEDRLELIHDEEPTDAFRHAAAEFLYMAQQNNDVKLLNTEFSDFMRKVRNGEDIETNVNDIASTSSQEPWSPSHGTSQETSSDWTRQFNQEMKKNGTGESENWQGEYQTTEKEFWDKMASEWEKISTRDNIPWLSEFYDYSTLNKEYSFSTDNPMENMVNALEEGQKRLGQGDFPGAVLCFEAAVKQNPDNAHAWQLLGTTQAENEQDIQAIAALNKCISLDPNNLTALMGLAVSYTNESYQNQACKALKEWIRVNPKYADLLQGRPEQEHDRTVSSLMSKELYDQVKGLLLEAARRNPQESIDADVQTGLSVIFNLSGEVDLAADCCTAALSVRPNDWRLWNRLGATLANGGRSEEAVDAYRNALQLSPGFIRARYNLGISCVHLKAYREAAEHLLTALNQQVSAVGLEGESNSSMSDTIWTTLRLVISLLERPDLMTHINNRDLGKLNEAFSMN